jgi:fermentation-respiration switch protein FrsA (DUF1100 family)
MTSEIGIDPKRCAAFGRSLGAVGALMATAADDRIAACVALMPFSDGRALMRECRREWEWREFEARVIQERAQRTRTGESTWVTRHEILVPDPEWQAYYAKYPERIVTLPLETAESFFEARPLDIVGRISPRPLLFIHGSDDVLISPRHSVALHAAAGEPKELLLLQGATHDSTYHESRYLEAWSRASRDFFLRYVGSAADGSGVTAERST